jgi:ZIP family zinc transporter
MLFIIVIAACCATLLGGVFAMRMKDHLHLILGFSAGAIIGVAFFDLIPEALEIGAATVPIFHMMGFVALGFLLYLGIDRSCFTHCHEEGDVHQHRGSFVVGSLSFHSFLDGMAVGLAFQSSPAVGMAVAAAVVAHTFSDGINTVGMVLRNGGATLQTWKWLAVAAGAPVAGAIVSQCFSFSSAVSAALLALFGGFFLYIGTSELLPESHHTHPTAWTTGATIAGIVVMYAIATIAGI